MSSSTIPAGVYSVTAVARDSQGRSATSSPVQVKISKALKAVRNTRKNASVIDSSATSSSNSAAQGNKIDSIVTELEQAYFDFHSERAMFDSAKRIENHLFAALFLARSSASLAKQGSLNSAVSDRMSKFDAYLGFSEDLMADGVISGSSLNAARSRKREGRPGNCRNPIRIRGCCRQTTKRESRPYRDRPLRRTHLT